MNYGTCCDGGICAGSRCRNPKTETGAGSTTTVVPTSTATVQPTCVPFDGMFKTCSSLGLAGSNNHVVQASATKTARTSALAATVASAPALAAATPRLRVRPSPPPPRPRAKPPRPRLVSRPAVPRSLRLVMVRFRLPLAPPPFPSSSLALARPFPAWLLPVLLSLSFCKRRIEFDSGTEKGSNVSSFTRVNLTLMA